MPVAVAEKPFWMLRYARTIFFFTITLAVAGIFLAFQIPVSVFPETNFPRVVIGVDNGVMPVEQMQVTITQPIEAAVNSVPGLQTVRSTTSRGSAEVSLFFNWNVNMFQTLQLVDAALSKVEQTLPPTARITTNRLTFATFPILGYSLTSKTVPQTRLWQIANYDLKPPLNRLDGVSTVTVQGGQIPEFHVIPNLVKLQSASVTISDIVTAIDATNRIDSPGLYNANHQLILGLVGAQVRDAAQLAQIVVKTTSAGVAIRLVDVADVVPSTMPVYTVVTANGQPAVLLNIARQPSGNTVAVADEVAAEVARLKKTLPPGVDFEPFYDQSHLVRESIKSVRDAILIGIVLASAVLVLFLRDWSSSLVAGLVIPVTIFITFIFLRITGQSFDLMTLGGLAAAVGLIIDDAIVVVENIALHRDAGETRTVAVQKALREITTPLVGSTITPIVVFLPLISVTGVTGSFFRALAITMTAALLTSLLLALTWTPGLSMFLLRRDRKAAQHEESGDFMKRILQRTPEVETTSRRTGLQMGLAAVTEANTGDITVKLKDRRSRDISEVMEDVRQQIKSTEPELDVQFTQVLQDMIGDLSNAPEPVQIKLFSNNQQLLNELGERVGDAISKLPGVVDVENGIDNTISGPTTSFQINPAIAARSGFTPDEVTTDATAILDGIPATQPLIDNGRAYTIRVRLDDAHRASLDAIQNTIFNSSSGKTASLGSVAQIQQLPPQNEILRENLQRLVTVTGRLEGSDLGTAIQRVQQAVKNLHLPSTVRVEYGGTYQEQQKSFRELLRVLLLALVLVFGVLLAEFRNFYAPAAILVSSVLSTAGVVMALLITNTTFNVASFMGLIMVIGIVAKNGILLLDADEKFRAAGVPPHDAMLQAAQRRLRPILMTALAAITGMLPLTLGIGAGSQMLQPLAIAVVGGLLVSMLLSLVVTPAVYYFFTRNAQAIG